MWNDLYLPLIFAFKPSFVLVLVGYSGVLVDKLLSVRVLGRVAINLLSSLKLKLRVTSCRRAGTGRDGGVRSSFSRMMISLAGGGGLKWGFAPLYGEYLFKVEIQRVLSFKIDRFLSQLFIAIKWTVHSLQNDFKPSFFFNRMTFETLMTFCLLLNTKHII